ncbi:MAG: hypothetical protein ABI577_07895 [bacterium]
MTDAPIITGYVAPLRGHGATALLLGAFFAVVIAAAGAAGPNLALILVGLGGVVGSLSGLYLYWSFMRRKPAVFVYPDRVEFVRGHRRGVVPFASVTNVRALQWGGSLYPYTRAARFIILETNGDEWQFGPEVANCERVQEEVIRAMDEAREQTV